MKQISILGITGSIGGSALNVLKHYPRAFHLVGISAHRNLKKLLKMVDEYRPEYAVCSDAAYFLDETGKTEMEYRGIPIYSGQEGIRRICTDPANDSILNAISGKAGLFPSLLIAEQGKELALANKESVVCAGELLLQTAHSAGTKIIPVDSEHSALYFLLQGREKENVAKLYITASGGPFLDRDKSTWDTIQCSDALRHPTWNMGKKISIDSSTMANKGLEVIEAHCLFSVPYEKIHVLIHPQSLIHSMVEMIDGEIYAQIGPKDMSLPIQNALFYPEMAENQYHRLDFSKAVHLDLRPMDFDKFKMLSYAFYCGQKGGIYPAFYNFTNEYLVELFLNNEICYLEIERYMKKSIDYFEKRGDISYRLENLEQLSEVDLLSHEIVKQIQKENR